MQAYLSPNLNQLMQLFAYSFEEVKVLLHFCCSGLLQSYNKRLVLLDQYIKKLEKKLHERNEMLNVIQNNQKKLDEIVKKAQEQQQRLEILLQSHTKFGTLWAHSS